MRRGLRNAASHLIFASDFGTGLGTSAAALRDTGSPTPWGRLAGGSGEIISASGLNFPSDNCLRVTCTEAASFLRLVHDNIPVPGIGDSLWYRWYFRAAWQDGLSDGQNHPIEPEGANPWAFSVLHNQGGAGKFQPYYGISAEVGDNYRFYGPVLDKGETHRFELQVKRTGAATQELHARLFDSAGNQLASDAGYANEDESISLADEPPLAIGALENLSTLQCGIEGLGGTDWHPSMVYAYQGCFAVSIAGWCGPYTPGEVAA